jgi:tetratricopeptide (TPR) repeat protein
MSKLSKKFEKTIPQIILISVILFSMYFSWRLLNILDRESRSHIPVTEIQKTELDSLKTDALTKRLLFESREALNGYYDSFSILQSATGIIEVALAFAAMGIPLFLVIFYFIIGRDISQIKDVREEVIRYKEVIFEDMKLINQQRESASRAVLSSFRDYNPVYAQLDTQSIRATLQTAKKEEEFTHEDHFLVGGTYYIDKNYEEAATSYQKAKQKQPEPLYDFYLGLCYDDHFSSRKFENNNTLDDELIALAQLALEHYGKAARSWNDYDKKSLALSNMAFTYLELGKTSAKTVDTTQLIEAEHTFKKAEKFNEHDPFIQYGLAITAYFLGKKEEAMHLFRKAERLEYTEMGKQYEKMYSRLQFQFMRAEVYDLFKSRLEKTEDPK